jgi:hypothetical protein
MLINFLKTSVTTLINSNNLTKLLLYIKKGCLAAAFFTSSKANYLFITYIVTSKPKRISVAAGVVHMIIFLFSN